MFRFFISLPKYFVIGCIKFYQKTISKVFPHKCAFIPNCSSYSIGCIKKFGAISGSYLSIKRLLRCNPKNRGKVDEIPESLKGDFKWLI